MKDEQLYAIALSYLHGVGPIRARKLLAAAGSFRACFELDSATYTRLKIPQAAIDQLLDGRVLAAAEKEARFVERHEIEVVDCLDDAYPRRLDELADAPVVLYKRGNAGLSPQRTVAIVGTRKPTPHGVAACERLVEELQTYRATVISGLAYGVDIVAHRAALARGLPTFGVLAHGLGEIYPSGHKGTAVEMLRDGALVTEYPSGMRSRREFFPQRNRVIAGLADAVVVIESAEEGGSMITAKLCEGYNRALFAVPGRTSDAMSRGCNLLIKSQRASLLDCAKDIAYHLGWEHDGRKSGGAEAAQQLQLESFSPIEQSVVSLLQQEINMDIDTISHRASLESGQLASTLLELEFRGVVRALPGKRYTLS